MVAPIPASFTAGALGAWRIDRIDAITGAPLPIAERLAIVPGTRAPASPGLWTLRGVTSNSRYVEREERTQLNARCQPLGRIEATRAALIPITKTAAWWDLEQDERRAIFEAKSHHIAQSLEYL